ncbi:MAG: septation protein A [Burkholderiales bacterium]
MKLLFDLFPLLLFFVAFKLKGIFFATAAAITATVAQIAWVWLRHRKVERMLWINLGIITVFGGATLLLHDETFIKWKPTVLYWFLAGTLVISDFVFHKNLIGAMMGREIKLPEAIWRNLNLSWAGFMLVLGFLNLYIAFRFPTDVWVNFKVFGILGLVLVFIVLQGLLLAKHVRDTEAK